MKAFINTGWFTGICLLLFSCTSSANNKPSEGYPQQLESRKVEGRLKDRKLV